MLRAVLKPSRLIRRKALSEGIFGPSLFWKVVAAAYFGRSTLKRVFGKNVEVLSRVSLGAGRTMMVETSKPLSRRQRKKLKKQGRLLSKREQKQLANHWALTKVEQKQQAKAKAKAAQQAKRWWRRSA